MNNRPIGIIDSGIGGISILNEVIKYLPNENYIYYADSIHNPYGNKQKKELINIVNNIMKFLLKENVKLIIIACNTASTQVISYLRKTYPEILFVAVEPAIKVAYDYYHESKVLVMATPGTIHSDRLMMMDKKYQQSTRELLACNGLAELIENQSIEEIPSYLENLFKNINKEAIEVVVLGCTHYPFIKKEIEKAIGHSVIFIDGANGVRKRVDYLLKKNNLENKESKLGTITFVLTKNNSKNTIEKYVEIEENQILFTSF